MTGSLFRLAAGTRCHESQNGSRRLEQTGESIEQRGVVAGQRCRCAPIENRSDEARAIDSRPHARSPRDERLQLGIALTCSIHDDEPIVRTDSAPARFPARIKKSNLERERDERERDRASGLSAGASYVSGTLMRKLIRITGLFSRCRARRRHAGTRCPSGRRRRPPWRRRRAGAGN